MTTTTTLHYMKIIIALEINVYFLYRKSFGVSEGCQRTKQCIPNPCQNGGLCTDQWDSFVCHCQRPFLAPYCIEKINEFTFGHQNQSSITEIDLSADSSLVEMKTHMSVLLRTNKPNGTIFYIGEKVCY